MQLANEKETEHVYLMKRPPSVCWHSGSKTLRTRCSYNLEIITSVKFNGSQTHTHNIMQDTS